MRHTIGQSHIRHEHGQVAERLYHDYAGVVGLDALVEILRLWQSRRSLRRQMERDMHSYNDTMFEDAGMTREEAEREVRKPFWRA
ncbi:hypothetical protein [Rhizobium sp. CSW-27]|uniref:hypothetical protein n=1 Tax=Rhizobium sp. CSW-27 TaxID=2839985 RepID=UPI001C02F19E|nr:hypothetical protein [Rhizobium sp. CSW-27]MBT9371038.1 hypothetical protein [Rhizobium sp. CSW-27]